MLQGIRIHFSLAFLYLQNGDSKSKRSSHSVIDLTHKTIQKRLRDLQGFAVRSWADRRGLHGLTWGVESKDGVYTDWNRGGGGAEEQRRGLHGLKWGAKSNNQIRCSLCHYPFSKTVSLVYYYPRKRAFFHYSNWKISVVPFFNPLKGFRSLEQESRHDHRLLFRVTLGFHYLIKVQISLEARQLDL